MKMGVLVHPHSGLLCGAFLAVFVFFFWVLVFLNNLVFIDCSMVFHQNYINMVSTRGIINKNGILDPIKLWWVPQMLEMILPKSSHDRFCLKKSSPNARSTITISESVQFAEAIETKLSAFCRILGRVQGG